MPELDDFAAGLDFDAPSMATESAAAKSNERAEANEWRDPAATIEAIESILQYRFQDRTLLVRGMTHASSAKTRLDSNERLEFLGDAILGAVVCEVLFERFPEDYEGELTRIKSILVSRQTCARISERYGLTRYIVTGKGVGTEQSMPASILAAVFESLIAGIYLDGGFEPAREFVRRSIQLEIDDATADGHPQNHKSYLQQVAQKTMGSTPLYTLLDEKGPDHSKCFKVAAVIRGDAYLPAWGPTKKEAEQRAAENALAQLQGRAAPHMCPE